MEAVQCLNRYMSLATVNRLGSELEGINISISGQSKPAGKAKGKGKNIADGEAAAGNGEQSGATPQALEDVMMIDSDWDSISSSGEQPARRGGGSKAKPSKSKAAKPKVKVTAEEKKEARTANNPHIGNARKALRLLEPVIKDCKSILKCPSCPEDLKEELQAAQQIVKDATKFKSAAQAAGQQGKVLDPWTYENETCKELAKNIKSKTESTRSMDQLLSKMDETALANLKKAAEERLSATDVE